MWCSRGPLPCLEHDNGRFSCDGVYGSSLFEVARDLRGCGWSLSTQLAIKKAGTDDVLREVSLREIMVEDEESRREAFEASN
jgi:hypothetical protein